MDHVELYQDDNKWRHWMLVQEDPIFSLIIIISLNMYQAMLGGE